MQLEEKVHENVYYYTDVIENPQAIIDLINKLDGDDRVTKVIPKWNNWNSSSRDGNIFGKKKDFNLSEMDNLDPEVKAEADLIITTIRTAIKNIAESFVKDRGLKGTPNVSPFVGISKYVEGCAMGAHFDRQAGDNSLEYSIIIYWNEDYEGGEISFIIRDEDIRLPQHSHLRPPDDALHPDTEKMVTFTKKPKAGSALIFPSTDPYKHQVHIMKSGDKYITPGFIFVDGYKPGDPGGPSEEYMKAYHDNLAADAAPSGM
jgi:hypothetical protein